MIKKAVIPAAGYGTRSLPITKVIPKEMFPIGEKPAIQYIVEEAIASGIQEILIIVSRAKNLIVDYFDHSLELEAFLERKNKDHLLKEMEIPNIQIHYTRQPYARGLGDAIRLGASFAHNEPFAVLLPDDIVIPQGLPALQQLISVFNETGSSVIGLKKVERELLKNYGVVKGQLIQPGRVKIESLVEKPLENPPSDLAVVGRYVFTPDIFKYLEKIKPGKDGEYQLTDAIQQLTEANDVFGRIIDGDRYDIGNTNEYIRLINYVHKPRK
ncbi:UDP-glucose pyrophosphorylase [Bacillus oleivorans]|uniref:UTP--glucose-1-phosphate uridylyltransferase n=1 Tax=Bacillus oleivorans TaxID=1448271 RepID=A0A285CIK8_9BACI|nr:UTP--glucose-1-phosphate uridylyltransferase [Bacillus oleivorans]SNX66848.1 UDP-glucose pyrophosphorylase [Bacillus oleivorans]